jgi:hypothetical protein
MFTRLFPDQIDEAMNLQFQMLGLWFEKTVRFEFTQQFDLPGT